MTDFNHGTGVGNLPGITGSTQAIYESYMGDYLIQGGGESIYPRAYSAASAARASQDIALAGFIAKRTEPITQMRVCTHSTAAAATPSVCKMGVFRRETNGDLTLMAVTANDTTLFAATNTVYTKSFTTTFYKQMGVEYMAAILIVTGVAMPTFNAPVAGWPAGFASATGTLLRPAVSAKVSAQADFGAIGSTIANASVVASSSTFHAMLLP